MSSAQELKALLAPLRVYDLDAPFTGAVRFPNPLVIR